MLDLLARGLSNPEICKRLVISEATAKTHVARILQKLDLRDRVQAVIYAYETGVTHPDSTRIIQSPERDATLRVAGDTSSAGALPGDDVDSGSDVVPEQVGSTGGHFGGVGWYEPWRGPTRIRQSGFANFTQPEESSPSDIVRRVPRVGRSPTVHLEPSG